LIQFLLFTNSNFIFSQQDGLLLVHNLSLNYEREFSTMYIRNVSKPMPQTVSGYSPPPIKQKSSYQHGSKSEQVLSTYVHVLVPF